MAIPADPCKSEDYPPTESFPALPLMSFPRRLDERPFLDILAAQEGLIDILSFPPHLGSPDPETSLGTSPWRVRSLCSEPTICRVNSRMMA
jgi:hypothetical protein